MKSVRESPAGARQTARFLAMLIQILKNMNATEPKPRTTAVAKLPGVRARPDRRMSRGSMAVVAGLLAWAGLLRAGSVYVPNGSFESPETVFADPGNDFWQESAKPVWYDEIANGPWDYLTGVFLNTPTNDPAHIDNCDGKQAAFLFALPGVVLFQDYNSTYGTNTASTHDFNAKFEVGKSYHLTVGVIGGGGGMSNGVTLEPSLYYRDGASNLVKVGSTSITNTPATFSNSTHFVDFAVDVPAVKAGDAWAGQNLGVQLLSTVGFDLVGGYWDVDNVRLTAIREPLLQPLIRTNGQFQFTLQSEPGLRFEILASTNLALAPANWSSLATLTNVSGTLPFTEPVNFNQRFYQARQLP